MKSFIFGAFALSAALLVSGCSTMQETNAEIDKGVHAPKRSMDMAKAIETDSYIGQINGELARIKSENGGVAPATLEDAKKAVKFPSDMWTDSETKLPLEYDAATGLVHRKGEAAKPAPGADTTAPAGTN